VEGVEDVVGDREDETIKTEGHYHYDLGELLDLERPVR
jgi:hypothetical protein